MPEIIEADDFDPKKIADALFERCKQAREWYIYCYVEEEWAPIGKPFPFAVRIVDGIFTCRVICSTYREAQKIVSDFLPVIKFIESPEIDNE